MGCYLTHRLIEEGNEVVLIELGGADTAKSTQSIDVLMPRFTSSVYQGGVLNGRAFGLGGTSAIWGGAMVPPSRFEKHLCPSFDQYAQQKVLKKFGIHGEFHTTPISDVVDRRNLLWPSFRNRNTRRLVDTKNPRLKLFLDTQVLKLVNKDSRIIGLKLKKGDSELYFDSTSYCVILAAGMIESTRLLLSSPLWGGKFGNSKENGGHEVEVGSITTTFSDHISAPIATLTPISNKYLSQLVRRRGWGFESVRYDYQIGESTGFLNVQFTRSHTDPFYALRQLLLNVQSRSLSRESLRHVWVVVRNFSWFLMFSWYFLTKKVVLPPAKSKCFINLVSTKLNRGSISLRNDGIDLDWQITDEDRKKFVQVARALVDDIETEFEGIFQVERHTDTKISEDLGINAEVFHPNGSFPFGDKNEVVTEDLKLRGYENIYLISSALFPKGGVSSPSFSLLCLAERFVTHAGTCGRQV